MKKACLSAGLVLLTALTAYGNQKPPDTSTEAARPEVREELPRHGREREKTKMKIQTGDTVLTATLENNATAAAFRDLITKNGGLSVKFSRYGGFEQVGPLGVDLPRNDVQTTTQAGDIVLYSGNQLVMFYGSNTWAYTKIGKIDSTGDLKNILGKKDITATFTIE